MPNIAAVLKEEICRLAKKEVKAQVGKTQKASAQYRRDIANLKRLLGQQEREIKLLKKQQGQTPKEEETDGERSLFGSLGQGSTKPSRTVSGRLWQAGRRERSDHLQLGARQIPSPSGSTCRSGHCQGNWQEGGDDEVG